MCLCTPPLPLAAAQGFAARAPTWWSRWAEMLVSSPSPSAALRPSPASPHTHHHHHHPPPPPPPPSFLPPTTNTNNITPHSSHSQSSIPFSSSSAHEPSGPVPAASSSHRFDLHSSRAAIEELRSALKRHTVGHFPSGPSGDLPRGRMSAGLTSSGGGSSITSDAAIPASHHPSHPHSHSAAPSQSSVPAATAAAAASASSAPAPASVSHPTATPPMPAPSSAGSGSNKRNSPNGPAGDGTRPGVLGHADLEGTQPKRLRPEKPMVKLLPARYELADARDLVVLISSMLMELIRFNDKIPLHQGRLTRFHSRTPPRISVHDYLQRLTTHATLSPPILLSMVYYIDRLCAMYPSFTVSSLTIHRFLITSATVASKGLSDSFWTNKTYARVGGISMTELALLELEFLFRVEWRIVPEPEVLVDYYQSLAERCDGYAIQRDS
ncbi:regulatory cyclin phoB [Aspergillus saccharolyticus JOP 1030-1]|uniref:Cyclin-domain-containing protein n=1 Tax=Aspergillus saccharolyticus JOP 1030-1 TaxID=1450539 RepID=A0A318Z5P7_9EURO|nr:cyclin-domain-containing protein [Aspergillus saccharolyticus JOP 1030-1]PYH42631.1 cyclin-domain-containing protein [Aspergillus saccharolyticus JOP 1030-1]